MYRKTSCFCKDILIISGTAYITLVLDLPPNDQIYFLMSRLTRTDGRTHAHTHTYICTYITIHVQYMQTYGLKFSRQTLPMYQAILTYTEAKTGKF